MYGLGWEKDLEAARGGAAAAFALSYRFFCYSNFLIRPPPPPIFPDVRFSIGGSFNMFTRSCGPCRLQFLQSTQPILSSTHSLMQASDVGMIPEPKLCSIYFRISFDDFAPLTGISWFLATPLSQVASSNSLVSFGQSVPLCQCLRSFSNSLLPLVCSVYRVYRRLFLCQFCTRLHFLRVKHSIPFRVGVLAFSQIL